MRSVDQGRQSARPGQVSISSAFAEVLLRRVAYSACFACTIELTGMRIGLPSTATLASAMTATFSAIASDFVLRLGCSFSSLALIDPLEEIPYFRVVPDLQLSSAFFPFYRDPFQNRGNTRDKFRDEDSWKPSIRVSTNAIPDLLSRTAL